MLARLKERSYLGELVRRKDFAESGHVYTTVYDSDHDITLGKFVAHIGEVGTATAAIAIDQMAIETASIAKNF